MSDSTSLDLIRPFTCPVLHEKNFDLLVSDTVSHDIGKSRNNKLTGSFDVAHTSYERVGRQQLLP